MTFIKHTVKTEEIKTGDVQVRIKGYSGNMAAGERIEYEVVAIEPAPKLGWLKFKLRNRKTNRCKSELQPENETFTVWRKEG